MADDLVKLLRVLAAAPLYADHRSIHSTAADRLTEQAAEIERLTEALAKEQVIRKIQRTAIDRWVPCPDHRDKVSTERDGCEPCKRERAEHLRDRAKSLAKRLAEAFDKCRERNPEIWGGFVSSELEDALDAALKKDTAHE